MRVSRTSLGAQAIIPVVGSYMTVPVADPCIGTQCATYDPTTGQYTGGSALMDWYCNSAIGQMFSPQTCGIPNAAQIQQEQASELAATQQTPENQQAAIQAGNTAVAADCAANPSACAAVEAASSHGVLSAMFGPSTVATLDSSLNPFAPLIWLGIAGLATLIVVVLVRR